MTIARIKVILTAAVTWITLASAIVVTLAPQISELFPNSAETVTLWSARIVAWLASAVAIIRRVAPVPAEERGIL